MKTLQKFSDDYLRQCANMNAVQIIKFLDDFRVLHGVKGNNSTPAVKLEKKKVPSKLISIKVPEDLLNVFKARAAMASTPYQTQIKKLMRGWAMEE